MKIKKILSGLNGFLPTVSPYRRAQIKIQDIKEDLLPGQTGIFLDCGGYDGCSALKFISINPHFSCVSFEPNPEMWPYYHSIPTTLIKKGVSARDQTLPFRLDHIDGDGSSIVPDKNVIYGTKVNDLSCKVINIECISIQKILESALSKFNVVILKLDVEGAEYEVLEGLYNDNRLGDIKKIYAEFHWKKCGFSKFRHNKLASVLRKSAQVFPWDGADFAIHKRPNERSRAREILASSLDLKSYQHLDLFGASLKSSQKMHEFVF